LDDWWISLIEIIENEAISNVIEVKNIIPKSELGNFTRLKLPQKPRIISERDIGAIFLNNSSSKLI
tara:strand:+ start:231 stop:428 length:198 start_codon:yes stop_codon:yes gene_type:complete